MGDKKRRILICLDLEAGSEELARHGALYARRLGGSLHILYVMPVSSRETEEAVIERFKALTEGALEGVPVEAFAIRRGLVEDHIVEYIRENSVEIVILGHRHKAKRERVYVGSTVKTVISLAPGPVLVVPIDNEG